MNKLEYTKMAELEDSYWWHVGRKSIVSQQLKLQSLKKGARILNVGCGTGGMIPTFEQYGEVYNVDVSKEAVRSCKKQGYSNVKLYDGRKLPYKSGFFDAIVATDVLEHIKDDEKALNEWSRVLKPGGILLITVPAYQWLWSQHDESLHHYRRYTATSLHQKINHSGMKVKKRSYAIVFSFGLIVTYRILYTILAKDNQNTSYVFLPRPINQAFINLLRAEAQLLKVINFPFGTSVLIVASNPVNAGKTI